MTILATSGDVSAIVGVHLAGQDPAQAYDIVITGSVITSISPSGAQRTPRGARLIDAQGASASPGLIDGHSHWLWGASRLHWLDLNGVKTLDALQGLLAGRRRAIGGGAWLLAHGLEYTPFIPNGGPHRRLIDEAAGDGPCYVSFFDLHSGLANTRAIETTRLANAAAPTSGRLDADHDGPTGFLVEYEAMSLIERHVPQAGPRQLVDLGRATLERMNSLGYTGLHMMNGRLLELDLVRELDDDDELPLRVECCWDVTPELDAQEARAALGLAGSSGRRWSLGAVKFWLDGVVDSGSAWLCHADHHGGSTTPLWMPPERYRELAIAYADAGFRVATHTIGDAAISFALETYAQCHGPARHRIEHLEVTNDENLQLLRSSSNVAASVQPPHMSYVSALRSDAWSDRVRDERWQRAWSYRDISDSGVHLVMGTDWPTAPLDPRQAFYWAQARRPLGADPSDVIGRADQVISGMDVLAGFTSAAAWVCAREDQTGSLNVGKLADIALWDRDLAQVSAAEALEATCLMTITEGNVVHDRLLT